MSDYPINTARMGQDLKQPILYRVKQILGIENKTPAAVNVQFPDVSFWQGDINFDIMRLKCDYVILRAGQGSFIDTKFERNRAECQRAGLAWGLYWFYDDRQSPSAQAAGLWSLFSSGQARPFEIFLDWENSFGGPFSGLKNVVACMERIESLMGMIIGMYTGYYWFAENTSAALHASQYNYLKVRPLWLAWYSEKQSDVRIPKPWDNMDVWQWGTPAVGSEYGVNSKEIDMNYRINTVAIPPPIDPPNGGSTMTRYKISPIFQEPAMSVRPDHNTDNVPVAKLLYGQTAGGDELFITPGEKWLKCTEGVSVNGWVAITHLGKDYCTFQDTGSETPPAIPDDINVNVNRVDGITTVTVNDKVYKEQ